MTQKVSSAIPSRQEEEQEDPASSDRSGQQRWGVREEMPLDTGHYSQGIWGLQQDLVDGTSVPIALPAGGGVGGVFDGRRAAHRRAEATSDGSATASTEATSKAMATAIGVAAASTQA